MTSQPNITEEELARRVIELHEKGLGCRRISTVLKSEGLKMDKDKACRIIREYKAKKSKDEAKRDRGFKSLKQKEEHLKEQLERERKREECRKSVADLTIELLMTSYEKRRQYFSDKKKLFQLTESIMQVRNPCLWKRFLEYCKQHSDPAIAVFTAIGGQENFEEQLAESASSERLDAYIERRLKESLDAWTGTFEEEIEKREEESSQRSKPEIEAWVDEEGYYNLLFYKTVDDNDEYS